jgi:hypothetical protein
MGQEKTLLLLLTLGHVDLGRLIPLLLTALMGLVALLVAIAANILAAHDAFAVASHALFAAVFAFAAILPTTAAVVGRVIAGA